MGGPPYRTWLTNVWTTTSGGQTASHFSRYELSQLGNFYEFVRHAGEDSRTELTDWTALRSIEGPGRPMSGDEGAALLRTIEEARSLNRLIEISGQRMREVVARAHLPYDRTTVDSYRDGRIGKSWVCRPLPVTPVRAYGSSPFPPLATDLSKTDPLLMR